jgi:hypothetical protein
MIKTHHLLIQALLIGAAVAVVATVFSDFVLPWSETITVMDMPQAQEFHILSGPPPTKVISGLDRAIYLLTQEPTPLIQSWGRFFLWGTVAAYVSGSLIGRGRVI